MRSGHWIALAGLAVAAIAGAIVATSTAGGGGKGPYYFYSGVHLIDGASVDRVYVENAGPGQLEAKVTFTVATVKETDDVSVAPGAQVSTTSAACGSVSCVTQVRIRSRSPLLVPSLRYQDTDGGLQERGAGSFILFRDGKRIE